MTKDRPTVNSGGIYLQKWLVPVLLGLLLAAGAAWTSTVMLSRNALPRTEAAQIYVPKDQYRDDREQDRAWKARIETKIDKLLER